MLPALSDYILRRLPMALPGSRSRPRAGADRHRLEAKSTVLTPSHGTVFFWTVDFASMASGSAPARGLERTRPGRATQSPSRSRAGSTTLHPQSEGACN